MDSRLPVGACLKDAAAFTPQAFLRAPAPLILVAAVFAAPWFLDIANSALMSALAIAAVLLLSLVRDGALYRLGVSADAAGAKRLGLGPLGLQFGKPELRLLAAGFLVTVFLLLIFLAGFVVSTFVAAAADLGEVNWAEVRTPADFVALGEPWKLALVAAGPLGLAVVLLILGVQLSLYPAATVGRGKVVSLDALALAEGKFLKLLAGLLIIYLPTLAVAGGRWLISTDGERHIGWLLAEVVVGGLLQPVLAAGFLSAAYRRLEYVQPTDTGVADHG